MPTANVLASRPPSRSFPFTGRCGPQPVSTTSEAASPADTATASGRDRLTANSATMTVQGKRSDSGALRFSTRLTASTPARTASG